MCLVRVYVWVFLFSCLRVGLVYFIIYGFVWCVVFLWWFGGFFVLVASIGLQVGLLFCSGFSGVYGWWLFMISFALSYDLYIITLGCKLILFSLLRWDGGLFACWFVLWFAGWCLLSCAGFWLFCVLDVCLLVVGFDLMLSLAGVGFVFITRLECFAFVG